MNHVNNYLCGANLSCKAIESVGFNIQEQEDTHRILPLTFTGKFITYIFSSQLGIPGKTMGTLFTPIPVEVTAYEPERVGG